MALVVRPISVKEAEDDIFFDHLLSLYADESSIDGLPKPKADMNMYGLMEGAGAYHLFGAYFDGLLVGFIGLISQSLPHYSVKITITESYFVAKAYRSTGAGLKLLRTAENHAKDMGSPGLLVSSPYGGDLAKVLPGVGYRPSNVVFFKGFNDE